MEDVKVYACEKCGVVLSDAARFCEPCAHALEEARQEEEVKAFIEKEEALVEQYMAVREPYFDENPDLAMVFEAMTFRRFLVVRYQTDYPDGTSVIRERKLLPSHVYQAKSTEGICVVAYDTYRREVRTFRIDKFRGARLGEIAPAPAGDAVTIYPCAYEVRRSVPQRVKNPGKYLATGNWSTMPLPQVLVQ